MLIRHEPQEFWSEASGNQDALIECYQFMAPQSNPSVYGAGEGGTGEAGREVMLVVGDPGCGATALASQLAHKLRTTGRNVLAMDKISTLEPGSFKANLDSAIRIPPNVSSTSSGSPSVGLNALQLAVLEARNYDCFIVHDVDIYSSDETAQTANAAAIIQLIRASPAARFVMLGVADLMEWLKLELKAASVVWRTVRLDPMPANSKFGHFITSVALRVLPPCPLGRIEALDVDAVHEKSGGKVGLAVRVLIHQIMDEGSPKAAGDEQDPPLWACDEDEFSLLERNLAETGITNRFDKAANHAASKATGVAGGRKGSDGTASKWEGEGERLRDASPALALEQSVPAETGLRHTHPAVDNESFSSWIARQSMGISHSAGLRLGDDLIMHCGKGGSDPDMQWSNLELLQSLSLADRLYISRKFMPPEVVIYSSSTESSDVTRGSGNQGAGMIPYSKALNYCPECFKVDFAAGLAPALRLDWRQPRLSVCLRHNAPVLLERLATSTFTILDKAWRAFAEYVGSPASRLTTQFPLQHSSSTQAKADNDRLVALAARMQTWFFWLTADTSPSAKAAEFLMSYWLQDPSESGTQGFARSYFFYRLTKPQAVTKKHHGETSLQLKSESARPRDVAVAYWMLGVGFGVIDTSEAEFIRDTTRPYSIPFPISRSEGSSVGGLAYNRRQRLAYLEFARSTLNDADYKSVAWALGCEGRP